MRRHFVRRQTLSLGFFGSLGVLGAWSCTGSVDETGAGSGGSGGGTPDGRRAAAARRGAAVARTGSGGATGGSGGATRR